MKKIEAIIRKEKTEEIIKHFEGMGIQDFTITKVIGHGMQKGHIKRLPGEEEAILFTNKVKIEICLEDNLAEQVVELLAREARTGNIGDGKIIISPLTDAHS